MMFGGRRQSRDAALISRIVSLCGGSRLWVGAYSAPLFENGSVTVDDDFLRKAGGGDYCFIENVSAAEHESETEKIVLFKWNRKYPSDFFFDIDLTKWKKESARDFPGSSHDKITEEVYVR